MKRIRRRKRRSNLLKTFFLLFCWVLVVFAGYVGWIAYREQSLKGLQRTLMRDKNSMVQFFAPRLENWNLEIWRLYDTKLPFSWRKKLSGLLPVFFRYPYQCKVRGFSKNGQSVQASLDLYYAGNSQKVNPGFVFYPGAKLVHKTPKTRAFVDCAQLRIFFSSPAEIQFLRGDFRGKEILLVALGNNIQIEANAKMRWGLRYDWGHLGIQADTKASFFLSKGKKSTLSVMRGRAVLRWRGAKKGTDSKESFLFIQAASGGNAHVIREYFPNKLYLGGKALPSRQKEERRNLSSNQGVGILKSGMLSFAKYRTESSSLRTSGRRVVEKRTKGKATLRDITPILLYPKHKATLSKTALTFRWSHPSSNSNYILQLSKSSRFRKVSNFKVRNRKNFRLQLKRPGVYYWRVFAVDRKTKRKLKVSNARYFRISK